jgi:hypothetical protein
MVFEIYKTATTFQEWVPGPDEKAVNTKGTLENVTGTLVNVAVVLLLANSLDEALYGTATSAIISLAAAIFTKAGLEYVTTVQKNINASNLCHTDDENKYEPLPSMDFEKTAQAVDEEALKTVYKNPNSSAEEMRFSSEATAETPTQESESFEEVRFSSSSEEKGI